MNCLFCAGQEGRDIFWEGEISVKRCPSCGHVFSSYQGEADFSHYFPDDISQGDHFWWREAHVRLYQDFREKFMHGRSGRLLDVGCGLGYFLAGATADQKSSGWFLAGVETSRPACDYALRKLGLSDIYCGSITAAGYPDNSFDLVTLWDVIEHLPDPRPVLSAIRRALKDGGGVFLATPNINIQLPKARLKKFFKGGRPGHYLEARDHLHNYSPQTLRRLLEECGFKDCRFLQLPLISSVSGRRSRILSAIKELWRLFSWLIFFVSGGRLNFSNLYVIAYK